jgi:protein TonB
VIYTAEKPVKPISLFNVVEDKAAVEKTVPAQQAENPSVEKTVVGTVTEIVEEIVAEKFIEIETTPEVSEANNAGTGNPAGLAGPAGYAVAGSTGNGANEEYVRKNYNYIRRRIVDCLIYPSRARQRGISGRSDVVFTINTDGSISDLGVRATSGSEILDNAALEAVKRAAPFKAPPALARIAIPVVFNLR